MIIFKKRFRLICFNKKSLRNSDLISTLLLTNIRTDDIFLFS